jgi:hypothetical protein
MATMLSRINHLQPSSPGLGMQQDMLGTAVTQRRQTSRQSAPRVDSLLPLPKEPEDARLTGGTRSLDRRLLALNLAGSLAKSALGKPELVNPGPAPERAAAPPLGAIA